MSKTWKIAKVEKYLEIIKETIKEREKTTPILPKTMNDSYNRGYLEALHTVRKDLEKALKD